MIEEYIDFTNTWDQKNWNTLTEVIRLNNNTYNIYYKSLTPFPSLSTTPFTHLLFYN